MSRLVRLTAGWLLATLVSGAATGCAGAPRPLPETTETLTEACGRESPIDVVHHAVALSLALDPRAIFGRGELRVRARRETSMLVLDAKGLTVSAMAVKTAPISFLQRNGKLCARLPGSLAAGEEALVEVVWSAATGAETPHFSRNHVWAGYLTSAWMPTIQDPAQRATLELSIDAPSAWKVAASGRAAGLPARGQHPR